MEIREIQEIINQKLGLDDIEIGARITQTYETLGEVYSLEMLRDLEVIEIVEYKKVCKNIFDCPKEKLSELGKNMTEGPVFQLTAFNGATQFSEGYDSVDALILPSGHYSAPEALSDEKFNIFNDMYSRGLILQDYTQGIASQGECMTHGFPSTDESDAELLNVSADLMKVITKMTEDEPADRYQSLEEQLEAFENLL